MKKIAVIMLAVIMLLAGCNASGATAAYGVSRSFTDQNGAW